MLLYERLEHFGAIIFNPRTARYHQLDRPAAEALQHACDHAGSPMPPPGSIPIFERIVGAFPDAAKPARLVHIENRRAHPAALSAPLKAFLNVTRRCNLSCRHCYNASGGPAAPELDLDTISATLRVLQAHGVMRVTLSGGEPLCHPDFERILEVLRDLDLDVSLITNGVALTDRMAEHITATSNLRSVTVSLDGSTAEENDAVRGQGSFERVLGGLRRLTRCYDRALAIRITLMQTNAASIVRLPALLARLGVRELKVNRMNPYGRGATRPDLMLSDDACREARNALLEVATAYGIRMEVPSHKYQVDADGLLGLCRAGEETCEIDADGNVYPCSFSSGRFLSGNIVSDAFEDILLRLQRHSINDPYCRSCRGRGGTREKPVGFIPELVVRSAC